MAKQKPLKTYISDNFPLKQLECQYFNICKYYNPETCFYNEPCDSNILLGGTYAPMRETLRVCLEDYVEVGNLKMQIKLILEEK